MLGGSAHDRRKLRRGGVVSIKTARTGAIVQNPKEPPGAFRDRVIGAIGLIIAGLAVRYGNQLLVWFGAMVLFIACADHTRHWSGYKRWGTWCVELIVIVLGTYYLANYTALFEDMPGMSLQAVIKIPSGSIRNRQYIVDFGGKGDGEIAAYIAPDGIFTLSVLDRKGEPYDLQVPMGKDIPFDQFVYLVCDVGLDLNRAALRISLNGREIRRQEWPYKLDVGYIGVKDGVLGGNLNHTPGSTAFELATLFIFSRTLREVDREKLREAFKNKYALPIHLDPFLWVLGAFKQMVQPVAQ